MKMFLLAVALLGTGLLGAGLGAPPPRPVFVSPSSRPNFPRFPRPAFPHPNRNWVHGYWRVHRYGYWNHHRGYWTYQRGRHVFVNHD